jgi:VanZ family protein
MCSLLQRKFTSVSLSEDPIITKVLPRRIERPNVFQKIRPVQPLPVVDDEEQPSTNIVDKIHNAWIMLRLIPHLFTISRGLLMKNWKTTVAGVVSAIALVVNSVTGYTIPQEAITAVAIFIIGFFAEDSK